MPGSSSLANQRTKNCPIAEASSRPLSIAFPVDASSQAHSMVSSPEPRMVSDHARSQQIAPGLPSGMVSSPEPRMVSTHDDSQSLTPGLIATRTPPNLAPSSKNSSTANLVSLTPVTSMPVPGQKSSSNIQPALNLLQALDKRRKPMVISQARWRTLA